MREYVKTKKAIFEIERKLASVTCNKCGVVEDRSDGNGDDGYDDNYASFGLSFGYGSRYDNEHWCFDLCEDCLTELVKTFVVVPEGFGEDSYYAKYPQVMFDNWKATGEVDVEAGMSAEEIVENGGSVYGEDEAECDLCDGTGTISQWSCEDSATYVHFGSVTCECAKTEEES